MSRCGAAARRHGLRGQGTLPTYDHHCNRRQEPVHGADKVLWRPQEKRLVLGIDRFDWVAAVAATPELRRCRSALRFDRVLACKCKHVDPAGKDGVLNLLAVEFEETEPPAGVVTLFFSGGPVLRLEVECLEAELADLGPSWTTVVCPAHVEDAARARG
jgi:hypothetical protein